MIEFLTINESMPDSGGQKKRGRKKTKSIIGQLGAGKDNLSGIIDIAVMQSLNRMGEVKDGIKNYGVIIVESHDRKIISNKLLSILPVWYNVSSFFMLKMLKWV